jgi:hypothetical protein
MAQDVYDNLVEICKRQKKDTCKPVGFESIKRKVWNFIVYRPKLEDLYEDEMWGQTVVDVRNYTGKIKKLDPSYEITDPREQAPREEGYQKMLARKRKAEERRVEGYKH